MQQVLNSNNQDKVTPQDSPAAAVTENGCGSDAAASQLTSAGTSRPGAAASSKRKDQRVDVSHLLRFQYEGRGAGSGARGGGGTHRVGQGGRRPYSSNSRPQKYDRNKFLQANYRFLVSDGVDAKAFHADADRMLDWDDVIQVEMLSGSPVQCPISLDAPPLCPQITPCGHIFGFPSIMQHLIHHGGEGLKRSAPCPLCFAPLVARELRLALVTPVTPIKVGSTATFKLLKRGRTTIQPQCAGMETALGGTAATPAAAAAASTASNSATSSTTNTPNATTNAHPHSLSRAASSSLVAGSAAGGGGGGSQTAPTASPTAPPPPLGSPAPAPASPAPHQHPLRVNRYSKFATVDAKEAMGLWAAAASELAAYAAQLTAEGGMDAAQVAPYIYASLDALALRARRWATHRVQVLAARQPGAVLGGEGVGSDDADREGAEAEAAVKKLFMAAADDAAAAQAAAAEEAAKAAAFPSLTPAPPPPRLPAPPAAGSKDTAGAPDTKAAIAAAGTTAAGSAACSSDDASPTPAPVPTSAPEAASGAADEGASGTGRISGDEGGGGGGGGDGVALLEMGTSVSTLTPVNASTTAGDFFMYQAVDGQWVFMDPLSVRCLLAGYGTYDACPPTITARVVELEAVEQSEATRRRWRFLSHLPLRGSFQLAEVDLQGLLPAQVLAPFAAELAAREKRRRAREREGRRAAARERAAAKAADDARRGPTAAELKAMPTLAAASRAVGGAGAGNAAAAAALAAGPGRSVADAEAEAAARALGFLSAGEYEVSMALQASLDDSSQGVKLGGSPPSEGVSFARITQMGFAATGPTLGGSPPSLSLTGPGPSPAPTPTVQGAWAAKKTGSSGAGSAATSSGPAPTVGASQPSVGWGMWGATAGGGGSSNVKATGSGSGGATGSTGSVGGKGKGGKGKGALLFSTAAPRKY